eukprot:scaffold1199_cov265-Pinguiococcus_pyrenoidosus.AAC.20
MYPTYVMLLRKMVLNSEVTSVSNSGREEERVNLGPTFRRYPRCPSCWQPAPAGAPRAALQSGMRS